MKKADFNKMVMPGSKKPSGKVVRKQGRETVPLTPSVESGKHAVDRTESHDVRKC